MFNKINKNLIISILGLSAIFIFAFVLAPKSANANVCNSWVENGLTYTSCDKSNYTNQNITTNPVPYVGSTTSNNAQVNTSVAITVYGYSFVQGSVVRFNNYDIPTTFINANTLKAQLSNSDLNQTGIFSVTVFNPAPGGGLSNGSNFTVRNTVVYSTTTTNNPTRTIDRTNTNTTVNNTSTDNQNQPTEPSNSSLAAGAIFGSNAFFPSSIFQWIFFAILILLAVILWRKLYVSDNDKNTPLKHA
jgi:hypothetical protein